MSDRPHIGLDNPAFYGRLRQPQLRSTRSVVATRPRSYGPHRDGSSEQHRAAIQVLPQPPPASSKPVADPESQRPIEIVEPQPYAKPAQSRVQRSNVLTRAALAKPRLPKRSLRSMLGKQSKLQISLVTMACFIFSLGLFVAVQTVETNHDASTQVAALAQSSKTTDTNVHAAVTSSVAVPSTVKPSAAQVAAYTVPADEPRYISIPSLGINKVIILNLGLLKSGALATPPNVFETGWYNQSSKPGQQGAMLIDGHVSSWTSQGIFYGLKDLKPGDAIQIQTGAGKLYNYKVMASQTYPDTNVNMQSAMTPITADKPGLNLITCDGKVRPGTSEFNQRIVVFAQQI